MTDRSNKIGAGAYGDVYNVGDYAVKHFPNDYKGRSIIREVIVSQVFVDCPNVLTIEKLNLEELKHYTKYCPNNFKKIIAESKNYTFEEKLKMLESLLYG